LSGIWAPAGSASQSFDFIHISARRLAAPKMMPFAY
jgi:hypothetical protein